MDSATHESMLVYVQGFCDSFKHVCVTINGFCGVFNHVSLGSTGSATHLSM